MSYEQKGPMVNVGFGNYVFINAVVAVLTAETAPAKRIMRNARLSEMLLDATSGRRTRAIIVTSSGHIVASAISSDTLAERCALCKTGV